MFRREALELGRFKRDPDRWQTEFGRWVADFRVPRIVAGLAHDPNLRVTNQAVAEWLRGYAALPARATATSAYGDHLPRPIGAGYPDVVSPLRRFTPPLSFESGVSGPDQVEALPRTSRGDADVPDRGA